jgi:predicted ATP-dependent endonuclease of OLD family
MNIRSLSFENFRSFRDKTKIDLKKVNVFVGPNKAGKSNIIKCLQILTSISRNDWHDLHKENVFDRDNNKKITIEVEFYLNTEDRQHLIKTFFPNASTAIDYAQNLVFEGIKYLISFGNNEIYQEIVSVLDTKGEYKDLIIHEFENAMPNQHVSNLAKIKEVDQFDSIELENRRGKWRQTNSMLYTDDMTTEYGIRDLIIKCFNNVKIYPSANIQSTIDFASLIIDKLDIDTENYVAFLRLVSEMIDIPKIQINRNKPSVAIYNSADESRNKYNNLEFKENGLNSLLSFYSLSYGSQQFLHMLLLIEESRLGETICIEEPENHLHSHVQKRLFSRITHRTRDNDVQFFITTHSPIFTSLDKDIATTYLVTRNNSVSKVTSIDNESQLRLIKRHLGIDHTDIYLSPYVIFVEGKSEEISIQIVAEAMGYHQIGKEVRIINFGGKNMVPRLTEFLNYINYFDTHAIVLADGHMEIKDRMKDLKRGRLNFYDMTREEGKEFEDLFDSKSIINAMTTLGQQEKFKFEMFEDHLQNERKQSNVADILERYMKANGSVLDKTSLARQLSLMIANEIKEAGSNRMKTEVEEEIEKIMKIILKSSNN